MNIKAIILTKAFQIGVAIGVSGTVSAYVSHRVTKKVLQREYQGIVNREIAEAREFYSKLNKQEQFSSPGLTMATDDLPDVVKTYKGKKPALDEAVAAMKAYSKESPENEIDLVERKPKRPKIRKRSNPEPYLITDDEFLLNDGDLEQITLTYYEDDDILADDKDIPVDDVDDVIGNASLVHFSNDPDRPVVYVRNERLAAVFEVVLNDGNYAEIVHGIVKEPHRKSKKFRSDD